MSDPSVPRCDFCPSTVRPFVYFTNTAFVVPFAAMDTAVKAGEWAACSECAPLVEAGDLESMIRRGMLAVDPGAYAPQLEEYLRALLPRILSHITRPASETSRFSGINPSKEE